MTTFCFGVYIVVSPWVLVKNLYSENYVGVPEFPNCATVGLITLPRKRRVQGLGLSTSRKVQFLTMLVTRKKKFEKKKNIFNGQGDENRGPIIWKG
jgi:hypothetical protein